MNRSIIIFVLVASVSAQTRVDLANQGQNVDFRSAAYSKPFKLGSQLPMTCSPGEMFFLEGAPSGESLYGCVSNDNWEVQGRAGILHIESGDEAAGTRGIVNFLTGTGLVNVTMDAYTKVNVQYAADTAVLLTRAGQQSGETLLCASGGGSGSSYTCAMTPTLTAYRRGMVVNWIPDVNGTGGATTLSVDVLDAHPVKLADGVNDPAAGDIAANALYPVWFDGANFRLMKQVVPPLPAERPACVANVRGQIWTTPGGAGMKDEVAVCAKDETDMWQWRVIY